ncbi:MAG TPA: aminopeptidase [Gemmatimonadales bacterium]|nr:aminopeptidase [Gemmatimonadales bacterium]
MVPSRVVQWSAWVLLAGTVAGAAGCSDRRVDTPGSRTTAVARDPVRPAPDTGSASMGTRDYRPVAEKVVGQVAGVQAGEVVWLIGRNEDLPLLEDLAVEVQKRGASPLLTVSTERLRRRLYDEVPAQYDSVPPQANLGLAGVVDVVIGTESGERGTLEGVSPARIEARSRADGPVLALMRKRGVRSVWLGSGLYPSAERAEQYGVSRRELADMLYDGLNVDYDQLQQTGEAIRAVVAAGNEVHVTAPNGTDLRMRVAGRPVNVSDGIISAEDRRRGGPATTVWLPAGEVYLIPAPGSAEGVLVTEQDVYGGQRVEGLRLEFKRGKVVSMTAKAGLEAFKAEYDAAGRGKDVLSVLDFGINPGLKLPPGKPIHSWTRAGMVTVVVGDNAWAGGDINMGFGLFTHLANGTVEVDSQAVIRDGKLAGAESTATR